MFIKQRERNPYHINETNTEKLIACVQQTKTCEKRIDQVEEITKQ